MRIIFGLIAALPHSLAPAQNWPAFGNDPGGSQFSPLKQITVANAGELRQVWIHHSRDSAERGSLESVPIVINDLLYTCTGLGRVLALDPATGTEKWAFDPYTARGNVKALYERPRKAMTCRGVAYWQAAAPVPGVACEKRIFKPDMNGNVYAIDADTGKSCRNFGVSKGHPGYVTQRDFNNHGAGDYGMDSPPAVAGDVVVTTIDANDSVQTPNHGMVRAFDARTGEMIWEFDPIPPEHGSETGAANVWSTMSVDPDLGWVFLPTTSPSTDYYGGNRKFEMPLTQATVALDIKTGVVKWAQQLIHHDTFDYDLPGHPLLITIRKDGHELPVAVQQTKMGYIYVFDRLTGTPIYPIIEKPTPQSNVEGEQSSPTQPVPIGIASFARQTLTRDLMFGLTPIDRAWCQHEFDKMRYDGMYTAPSEAGSLLFPSALGGGNWGGAAFDVTDNILIIKAENLATWLAIKKAVGERDNARAPVDYINEPLQGTPYRVEGHVFVSPIGVPCTPPPWGTLTAIDLGTGRLKWQVPLGQSHRYGITVPASFGWGSPNIGGPIVTAGGVVFIAGTADSKLRAIEAVSGRELWQAGLPWPGMSVPITYMLRGRQYVVISAGGHYKAGTALGDATVAFALNSDR